MELNSAGLGHQDLGGQIKSVSHWSGAHKPVGGGWALRPLCGIVQVELASRNRSAPHCYIAIQLSTQPSDFYTIASLENVLQKS